MWVHDGWLVPGRNCNIFLNSTNMHMQSPYRVEFAYWKMYDCFPSNKRVAKCDAVRRYAREARILGRAVVADRCGRKINENLDYQRNQGQLCMVQSITYKGRNQISPEKRQGSD